MYATILLPTDGSPGTDSAATQAIELAQLTGASLHVLYSLDTGAVPLDVRAEAIVQSLETTGRESVDELTTRATDAGVETTSVVREGRPHRVISEYAAEIDADLIVMGTHGRHGLDRALLGSSTERVLRTVQRPILAVPLEAEETTD